MLITPKDNKTNEQTKHCDRTQGGNDNVMTHKQHIRKTYQAPQMITSNTKTCDSNPRRTTLTKKQSHGNHTQ